MKIEVLISTIDAGIEKISDILLPIRKDVSYIVSHQFTNPSLKVIPEKLLRKDVFLSQIPGKGLTKSRNNAIRIATGDICVIADDDVRYTNEYFDTILDVYENDEVELACFKIYTGQGQSEFKNYPEREITIADLQTYLPSSIEITFRLKPIIKKRISFDERFGIGSRLAGGEEKLFIFDAIKKGITVKFFPQYIVEHPIETTTKSFPKYAQQRIMVGGALDARINGWFALPRIIAGCIRKLPELIIHKKNPFIFLYQSISAALYILFTKRT